MVWEKIFLERSLNRMDEQEKENRIDHVM